MTLDEKIALSTVWIAHPETIDEFLNIKYVCTFLHEMNVTIIPEKYTEIGSICGMRRGELLVTFKIEDLGA